ncbi:MAG: hypothetical protein JSV18_06760 [Candidatus Bathyarchaeota archaeon]|nr:MAG: hypothetical protein JSV18_06760 [Candidatus Bathyarchaeota archaeon]
MSQGDSQESGSRSLEEEILRRSTQKKESPEENQASTEAEEEASSLEAEILKRYTSNGDEPAEAEPKAVVKEDGTVSLEEGTPGEDTSGDESSGPESDEPLEVDEADDASADEALEPDVPQVSDVLVQERSVRASTAMPTSPEEVVQTLRRLREDVGQISELSSEEGNIVAAFSLAFLKLMEPLTKALPVDASVLPPEMGLVERANVVPKGDLVVLLEDGRMESIDLKETENRDLLITVVSDVMPRFNRLISQRRNKIEKRIDFLSSVTKELQTIADSFVNVG